MVEVEVVEVVVEEFEKAPGDVLGGGEGSSASHLTSALLLANSHLTILTTWRPCIDCILEHDPPRE